MFNEISRLTSNRKVPRAKIKSGFAFSSGNWKDIIDTIKDENGNELYCILVGNEGGQQITRWHLERDITIKMFDVENERKEKEIRDRREYENLRRRQAESERINDIRLEISRLEMSGYKYRAAMLEYDLERGLI